MSCARAESRSLHGLLRLRGKNRFLAPWVQTLPTLGWGWRGLGGEVQSSPSPGPADGLGRGQRFPNVPWLSRGGGCALSQVSLELGALLWDPGRSKKSQAELRSALPAGLLLRTSVSYTVKREPRHPPSLWMCNFSMQPELF